jgi:putative ABC transport system permease protein
MSIGFRKIFRDLWRSKGRTALAVLSIFIGVFAVGMVSGVSDLLPTRMINSYRETNPSHITIYLSGAVSDDDLTALSRLPGVAGIQGERDLGARWRKDDTQPLLNMSLKVRPDFEHQQFNTFKLIGGRWPVKNDEAAVERSSVTAFGIPLTGTITMAIGDRERPLKIVGEVEDISVQSPSFGGNAAFYVSRAMAENVFGARGYNQLSVQVPVFSDAAAEDTVGELKPQLEKIGAPVFFYQITPPTKHPAQDTVNGINLILGVMAVLSLMLGLFLVINTINAVVAQQVPQIGVMKAIGGTTAQMLTLYLSGVLVYGLLALIIALPLGALAANGMTNMLLGILAIPPEPGLHLSQAAVMTQAVVSLLVPLLAALWPVFAGVRITVREAISSYGISGSFGRGLLDRVLARLRFLPRTTSLTIRNTFRRKGRVALTQITLVMAGVVFIMVMSSAASFTYTINFLTDTLGLKVLVNFQQPYRVEEITSILGAQPNVDVVEVQLFQSSTAFISKDAAKGEDIFINAFRPDSKLLKLPITTGRWLLTNDDHAVVLNQDRARVLGVNVGDKVWISLEGDKRSEWTVVGTVFDLSNLQRNVYVPLSVYQREVGLTDRATSAWLSTTPDDGATQLQVEKQLRDALSAKGLRVGNTQTAEQIRTQSEANFSIITTMLLVMSTLIAAVGAIGLAGTLSINVLERRREIGVMRAIGASSLTIAGLFIGEGLILGLIAWVVAIPLSIPVGQVFATVIGQVINLGVIYQFSWSGATTWLIIIVVLSVLGSAVPAIRATRVSVRESLAYE